MTKTELNSLYGMRKNILSSMYGIQSKPRCSECLLGVVLARRGILIPGRCIYVDTDSVKYIEEIDCKQG